MPTQCTNQKISYQPLADCFTDYRDPDRREHKVGELLAQRVFGLALGYEDLNDHEQLRSDPLWATLAGKAEPDGTSRTRERDRGTRSTRSCEDGLTSQPKRSSINSGSNIRASSPTARFGRYSAA